MTDQLLDIHSLYFVLDIGEWKITMSVGNNGDQKSLSSIFMFDSINGPLTNNQKDPGDPISILIRRKHIGIVYAITLKLPKF